MIHINGQKKRTGFTLIEVLVVIFIIALLAALAIPAVQGAREAARRSECVGHLHQIGIALSNYESIHACFPSGRGYSYLVSILPMIEQASIFNTINFMASETLPNDDSVNWTSFNNKITLFICPSDPAFANFFKGTSYAGNRGADPFGRFVDNGAFSFFSRNSVRMSDFTDGTSQTVAAAEWVAGTRLDLKADPLGSVFATNDDFTSPQFPIKFAESCHSISMPEASVQSNSKGEQWMSGDYMNTLYNHILSVNDHSCMPSGHQQVGAYTASSRHAGGANALYADGHVAFEKESINPVVWRAVGTRNGGEVVGF